MTEIQVLQVLGIAYVSMGLGILFNQEFYCSFFGELARSAVWIYLFGIFYFALGYIIIVTYDTWSDINSIAVCIFGYISFFRGIATLAMPHMYSRMAIGLSRERKYLGMQAIFILSIGVLLLYLGAKG